MVADTGKGKQGKRYSGEEKAEIIEFIKAYNSEHKRGGMKSASEKYGVSVVTLSNWSKKSNKSKKRKPKGRAGKGVKTPSAQVKAIADNPDVILDRLQTIRTEISGLEKEYNLLKKKL